MIRIAPATVANTKPDSPGSKEPAQIKINNQHSKLNQAMPVRTPQCSPHTPLVAAQCAENGAVLPTLVWPLRVPRLAKRKPS